MSHCWHTNTYPEKAVLICFVGNHCEEVAWTVAIDGERVQILTLCTNIPKHMSTTSFTEISGGKPGPSNPVRPGIAAGPRPQQQRELLICRGNLPTHTHVCVCIYKRKCLAIEDSMNKLNECLKVIGFFFWFFFLTLQLEDKRAEMERQFISMKVQYQSLQKQHAFSKQQLQRMKVLCLKGNIMLLLFKLGWIQLRVCYCVWMAGRRSK